MGMDATGRYQAVGILITEVDSLPAFFDRSTGYNHLPDAGIPGAFHYSIEIFQQALVGQVNANVDQFHH
jgi:hypothetical protein